MVWGKISMDGYTDFKGLGNGTLTTIRCHEEILGLPVRPYAGAVGPGFLFMHGSAWLHVVRICRKFLEDEQTDTIDWPPTLT